MTIAGGYRSAGGERLAAQHVGARADVAVAVDDPERHVVAVEPFVVVDAGPVEEAAHVDASIDRVVHHLEAAREVARSLVVVVGADPELGDEERSAGQLGMESVEDTTDAVGPDAVAER